MIKLSCPSIGEEEITAVSEVLESLNLAQGAKNEAFEARLSKYTGRRYALTVSSGTAALRVALQSCGVSRGDKVILSPFACDAVLNAILDLGCEPIFVDIEEDTFNISSQALKEAVSKKEKAKAIILVHNFGLPCDMHRIQKSTEGIAVVEDAAQAIGTTYEGKMVGSFGNVSVFSFYATKLLTTGEGGAITTDSAEIYQRAKHLRMPSLPTSYTLRNPAKENGEEKELEFLNLVPMNYKLTDFQAALGMVQLSKLHGFIKRRREIAAMYDEGLEGTGIKLPAKRAYAKHAYSRYTLTCRNRAERDQYVNHLIKEGIEVGILWPRPLHLSPKVLRILKGQKHNLPVSESIAKRVFSIPIHPNLTDEEVHTVIKKITEISGSK